MEWNLRLNDRMENTVIFETRIIVYDCNGLDSLQSGVVKYKMNHDKLKE